MGLLDSSPTQKKKSKSGSTPSRSSPRPTSTVPSPESLRTIAQLQTRIDELEAKDQGSTAEIVRLKKELDKIAAPLNVEVTPVSTGTKPDINEPAQRKSFFGY